jgi:hypothetical protein
MFEFLCEHDHFPYSVELCFVALALPEFDIELPVGGPASHNSSFELCRSGCGLVVLAVAHNHLRIEPM